MNHDIGHCALSVYDDDGFLTFQFDGQSDEGRLEPYEAMMPLGWLSRPLDPEKDENGDVDPSKACPLLVMMEGDRGHATPLGDPRIMAALPRLEKGEAMAYSPSTGAYCLFEVGGGIRLVAADGTAVKVRLGDGEIAFTHPQGASAKVTSAGFEAKNAAGSQSVAIGAASIETNGVMRHTGVAQMGGEVPLVTLPGFLAWAAQLEIVLATPSPSKAVTPAATMAGTLGTKALFGK